MATKRRNGVNKFWEQERTRLQNGENGTRNWYLQQKADILNGKRPTYNGKTVQGHHILIAYPNILTWLIRER